MAHYSKEKLSRMSEGRGWEHGSHDEARLAHPEALDSGSLLRIAKAVDGLAPIVKGIQEACFREVVSQVQGAVTASINHWTKAREEKHGPIPPAVAEWLWGERSRLVGRAIESVYRIVHGPEVPAKGTEARKAYDRWMKRKAPKAQKGT